jgi:hypothetical protein
MALYGEARDISFFRHVNRELIGNIISQECVYYKYRLAETKVNMYGEAADGRYFFDPVILNCLIERQDQEYPESDLGVDFQWGITFKFLRDDLLGKNPCLDNQTDNVYGANLVPEVGDVIMYQNGYYEVDNTNANQFFVGKNPDYPFLDDEGNNPLETDLANFGSSISIICQTHYVPGDRYNIQRQRL